MEVEEITDTVSVPCLFPLLDLEQLCEKDGCRLSTETNRYVMYEMLKKLGPSQSQKLISKLVSDKIIQWNDDFEVEFILDHHFDEEQNATFYLIKWQGWSQEYNTWEPEGNLNCTGLLEEYNIAAGRSKSRKRKFFPPTSTKSTKSREEKIEELFAKLDNAEIPEKMTALQLLKHCSPVKEMAKTKCLLGKKLKGIRFRPNKNVGGKRKTLKEKKAALQLALRKWQDDLNAISKGFDPAPIFVENNVDLEGPPHNFIYINERKEGSGVEIPKDPLVGCDCDDCYEGRHTCCPVSSGSKLAYYKSNGRLKVPRGIPIFECNMRCKCGPDCLNRVVQNGRKVRVCIFRTNSRGWGVKALQVIKKGSFVMEYVGEVITNEEAERRGAEYDACGLTYLFDLDFHDAEGPYSVDAGIYGNAAHFINHSCDPNLQVHVVWVNCLDPRFPHICLYAKRDIQKNEELTFDYLSGQLNSSVNNGEEVDGQVSEMNAQATKVNGQNEKEDRQSTSSEESSPGATPHLSQLMPEPCGLPPLYNTAKNQALDFAACSPSAPTPPASDTESLSGNLTDVIKSRFKMACLCGTKNCRKYLFI